jgi:hypothetical protein
MVVNTHLKHGDPVFGKLYREVSWGKFPQKAADGVISMGKDGEGTA